MGRGWCVLVKGLVRSVFVEVGRSAVEVSSTTVEERKTGPEVDIASGRSAQEAFWLRHLPYGAGYLSNAILVGKSLEMELRRLYWAAMPVAS